MKVAIIYMSPGFGEPIHATANVPRYLTQASQYKNSTRIFTEWVANPVSDLRYEFLPNGLPERQARRVLARKLRRFAPDIIEAQDRKLAPYLAWRFRGIPVTLHLHARAGKQSLWNRATRSLRFYPLRRVICVSDFARDSYARAFPEHAKRFMTIGNALPFDGNLKEAGKRERVIFWAGRVDPSKGLHEFIEAMARALPSLAGWRAVVAALDWQAREPDYALSVKKRFAASLGDKCLWLRNLPHDEVMAWMKRAAIFVAPAKWEEAFGLTALEAHIAGAALISSGRGGLREVSGAEGALYLSEVSAEAIAEAVSHLALDERKRIALAKRGQRYALAHHDIKNRAAELDQLRREITGED